MIVASFMLGDIKSQFTEEAKACSCHPPLSHAILNQKVPDGPVKLLKNCLNFIKDIAPYIYVNKFVILICEKIEGAGTPFTTGKVYQLLLYSGIMIWS